MCISRLGSDWIDSGTLTRTRSSAPGLEVDVAHPTPSTLLGRRSRILDVPYFVQPTPITCQSTCLKMMASYLERQVLLQSTLGAAEEIESIWKDINESKDRPSKDRNAHANMKWWLQQHYPTIKFQYFVLKDEALALERIVQFIDGGMPVLVSVSHARVAGHIVLVVGYEGYEARLSSPTFQLVVHDPYGRFDPSLLSQAFGKKRWEGGMSTASGGSTGPGQNCHLALTAVSRQRRSDERWGTYYLLSGTR